MEVEQRSFEFGPTKGFIVSFLLTKICLENANRIEYLIKGPKGLNFVPTLDLLKSLYLIFRSTWGNKNTFE